ncbi:MAG TPA: MMPL family transporter [Solirubrobacterales bacterium]|jgi:RND superfamily putative drug exporter|nr:MMPL family transporter [Solirubrobacterales bacterium]
MRRFSLAAAAVGRPRRTLVVWGVLIGVLGILGLHIESELHRSDLLIPGTTTERTVESLEPKFGQTFDEIVLLEGPRGAVDRQGERLTRRLEAIDGVSLIAPWIGANDTLRPTPRSALIVIRSRGSFDFVSKEISPRVRRISKSTVHGPVEAHVSGYTDIAAGIHDGTVEAIKKAELIAVPLLILILLAVFRSPVAAILPLFVGLSTIGATRGALSLINGAYPLDALALNIGSMMGLALGVDYALLMVSRFREQLAAGDAPRQASLAAARKTGHTILSAGIALVLAMTAAIFVVPGSLLVGLGFGLISAVVLSVFSALTALPAVLTVLGANVDRWTFGDVRKRGRVAGLAVEVLRHPAVAVAVVLIFVLFLSANATALKTGPPDPRALPSDSPQRKDYLAVKEALGGGWIAPYEIGITTDQGSLTEQSRLAAIDRFQNELARRSDVAAVLGPGQILKRTRPLRQAGQQLAKTRNFLNEGLRNQNELARGLSRIGAGVGQMRQALFTAGNAAGALQAGEGAATSAAERLHTAIGEAGQGARKLHSGVTQAEAAVSALETGSRRSWKGAARIERGIAAARPGVAESLPQLARLREQLYGQAAGLSELRQPAQDAQRGLEAGLKALDRMDASSKLDPEYETAYGAFSGALAAVSGRDPRSGASFAAGYDGLDPALASASEGARLAAEGVASLLEQSRALAAGLNRLETGSGQLENGLGRLDRGAQRLLHGFRRLSGGGGELSSGIGLLSDGSGRLVAGLNRLGGGAGELRAGLVSGVGGVDRLGGGVSRMLSGVLVFRGKTTRLGRQARQTVKLTPVFESGYFTLAAIDRASPNLRRTASFALSVDSGGGGARISVIGYGNPQQAGDPLRKVLEARLPALSRATRAKAQLGGTATGLQDFDSVTAARLPVLALVLSITTILVLVVILRSLLLPLLAVAFNLLTVAAAFGVTIFFFVGSDPLLGGPGFIDAITAFGIFSIMFGLSIDYEVFLLLRMREGYDLTGSTEKAIAYGVERTAGVITGAALIMTVVFFSFATTDITAARQLGLALAVAVILDATLIRLVLLPGAMRLCGRANWWLPPPLRSLLAPRSPAPDRG